MSSNPFKLVLKIPKHPPPNKEPEPGDGKPNKKRKHSGGRSSKPSAIPNADQQAHQVGGDQAAARDLYGEATKKRPKTEAQPLNRPRSSNAPLDAQPRASPKAQIAAKPRLIIKGSFGKTSTGQGGPSSRSGRGGQEGPNDQATQPCAALPGGLPDQDESKHKHRRKRKKKHRDRPPDPPAPGEEQKLPSKVSPSAGNADQPQPIEPAPSKAEMPVKVETSATLNIVGPPAKPQQLHLAPADSQAPSNMTGVSDGGMAVSSMPSGPVPTQARPPGATGQEASSSVPIPSLLPGPGDVERLINRLQKKDPYQIFKDPVTDAMAPGYSKMIKRPMSFSQMRTRMLKGEYPNWGVVQGDLETMFNNAMVFNGPTTPYHQKAREMMGVGKKMVQAMRSTGQLDARGRGRKPGSTTQIPGVPASMGAPLAERRTERRAPGLRTERVVKTKVAKKVSAKKAAQRLAASGVLARHNFEGGGGDLGPLPAELNTRVTFPILMGGAMEQQWKGLARGATASGVSLVAGRPTFRANFSGAPPLPVGQRDSGSLRQECEGVWLQAEGGCQRYAGGQPGRGSQSAKASPPCTCICTCRWCGPLHYHAADLGSHRSSTAHSTAPEAWAAIKRHGGQQTAGLSASPAWALMQQSRLAPAQGSAVAHPQATQKLAGPTIATSAGLYAGMQALSAANPSGVKTTATATPGVSQGWSRGQIGGSGYSSQGQQPPPQPGYQQQQQPGSYRTITPLPQMGQAPAEMQGSYSQPLGQQAYAAAPAGRPHSAGQVQGQREPPTAYANPG